VFFSVFVAKNIKNIATKTPNHKDFTKQNKKNTLNQKFKTASMKNNIDFITVNYTILKSYFYQNKQNIWDSLQQLRMLKKSKIIFPRFKQPVIFYVSLY
jgi:hypothetical protein